MKSDNERPNTKLMSIRIDMELLKIVEKFADDGDRSVGQQVQRMMRYWIENSPEALGELPSIGASKGKREGK